MPPITVGLAYLALPLKPLHSTGPGPGRTWCLALCLVRKRLVAIAHAAKLAGIVFGGVPPVYAWSHGPVLYEYRSVRGPGGDVDSVPGQHGAG